MTAQLALTLALLASSVLALSACGSTSNASSEAGGSVRRHLADTIRHFGHEATGSQAQRAEAAALGYLGARAAGQWSKACSYLTEPIRSVYARIAERSKRVKGSGCAGYVEADAGKLSHSENAALANSDVTSVRVGGGRGYVLSRDSAGAEYATPVALESSRWKVAGGVGALLGGSR